MPSAVLAEPTWHTGPEYTHTLGPEVADLAEAIGFGPYPEQRMFLDDLFAIGEGGKSASFESALICTRQQMKTGALKIAALGWLFLTDQPLVLWSAHEFATAQEAFRDLTAMIDGSDMLSRRVKAISRSNGSEGIELTTGERLLFKARTKSGGRGLTGHKVILDEAFALQADHMGALLPTMASPRVPDGQVVYASSAGKVTSDVLRGVRNRGREGGPRLSYQEHAAPRRDCEISGCEHSVGTPGCALDDRQLWIIANPVSYRHDPTLAMIEELRQAMPASEFARECLGWWDDPLDSSAAGINPASWARVLDVESESTNDLAIGLDMTPDRSTVNIAIVGTRSDGSMHAELIQSERTGPWVVPRVLELFGKYAPRAVVLDPYGAMANLHADLQSVGVPVTVIDLGEYAAACGELHDLVEAEAIHHRGQHLMDAAIGGSQAKALSRGGWKWTMRGDVSISPLIALTLALHGYQTGDLRAPINNVW